VRKPDGNPVEQTWSNSSSELSTPLVHGIHSTPTTSDPRAELPKHLTGARVTNVTHTVHRTFYFSY